jgi:hypothetical protein
VSMLELVVRVKTNIEGSTNLTTTLRKNPKYFDDPFCNLVHVGEQSDALEGYWTRSPFTKKKPRRLKARSKGAVLSDGGDYSRVYRIRDPAVVRRAAISGVVLRVRNRSTRLHLVCHWPFRTLTSLVVGGGAQRHHLYASRICAGKEALVRFQLWAGCHFSQNTRCRISRINLPSPVLRAL